MNDPLLTRRYVREVLALVPDRELTERMLLDSVGRFCREPLKVDELKAALHWNDGKGFVASRKDDDLEETVWKITAAGRAKEGYATTEGTK